MDAILTADYKTKVLSTSIGIQEVIDNIISYKFQIEDYYALLGRVISQSIISTGGGVLTLFNINNDITAYPNCSIRMQGGYVLPYIPTRINRFILDPIQLSARYNMIVEDIIIEKDYKFGLVDPLMLHILIDNNKFHLIMQAISAIRDPVLKATILGIIKFSLLDNELVLSPMSDYVYSTKVKPDKLALIVNDKFVGVKLKNKDIHYTIDYRILARFNNQ